MADTSEAGELEEDQFLMMPEKVLMNIISYVAIPDRPNIGLVCTKLYDLLCILEIDKHPLSLDYGQIYDDEVYDSIVSSGREFNDLTINLKSCRVVASVTRIEQIVRKFGARIKKFKLWCSVQSETAEISEAKLVAILECLPIIEELKLRNVFVKQSFTNFSNEELKLHKLTKLSIDYCLLDTPRILNRIPANILTDLVFTFEPEDQSQFQRFFNQQTKIKKLELFENEMITFDHLELEHIKISSSIDFAVMISQQPKLRYLDFAITWIDDKVFTALCQLKHLETLKMLVDQVSCHVFTQLQDLTRLKELRMDSHSSYDTGQLLELSMMRCVHLEKLTLLYTQRDIPNEVLIQMSQNFRRLKHIELINRSINIIGTILEYFPNLESILLDFFAIFGAPEDILVISDELRHENLRQLIVTNINSNINSNEDENTESLLKLVNVCPNLERIMLSQLSGLTHEDLKQILEAHPNLTHLSLEFDDFNLDYDAIAIILHSGKKLVHLRLNGLGTFPSYLTIKALFEDKFINIAFYKYSTGDGELIMRKRNIDDWYLNFKLMDHF